MEFGWAGSSTFAPGGDAPCQRAVTIWNRVSNTRTARVGRVSSPVRAIPRTSPIQDAQMPRRSTYGGNAGRKKPGAMSTRSRKCATPDLPIPVWRFVLGDRRKPPRPISRPPTVWKPRCRRHPDRDHELHHRRAGNAGHGVGHERRLDDSRHLAADQRRDPDQSRQVDIARPSPWPGRAAALGSLRHIGGAASRSRRERRQVLCPKLYRLWRPFRHGLQAGLVWLGEG